MSELVWPSGEVGPENAPPDVPVCGFKNEHCKTEGEYC